MVGDADANEHIGFDFGFHARDRDMVAVGVYKVAR